MAAGRLTARQAALLGIVHGPTELLPVSSSAHTALIPWLARWPAAELDPDLRKALEVTLHAGAALALILDRSAGARPRRGELGLLACSLLAPVAVGCLLEDAIERRLSSPWAIAAGLAGGSAAMFLVDRPGKPGYRTRAQAGLLDGVVLGLAQAAALAPGVSRSAATMTAARARGFEAPDARELAQLTAVPVIVLASGLKAFRLLTRGLPRGFAGPLLLAGTSSLGSTLAAARLLRFAPMRAGSMRRFALYRCGLALLVSIRAALSR